ncbi:MAG TPA: hypothetical protein DDY31_10790 [Lachnospiraceae bacterium]|nr:hypothetical protein [Lachnospiraceae bacterium]
MKNIGKKIIITLMITVLCFLSTANTTATASGTKFPLYHGSTRDTKFKPQKKLSKKERNQYFSNSAFIGNSIGKGLKMYFDSKGKGFLGNPLMLVQGCYSFYNDSQQGSEYQLTYQGKKMKAKDALAAAKVKRVFINMGTNDLWKPSPQVYDDYVKYIKGIRKQNPNVVIFIQGTTPMCSAKSKKYLNNDTIRDLNKRMEKYCSKHKDMYYIDISKGLTAVDGGLQKKYSSDGYVHMTMAGYQIWTDNLTASVDKLILLEKNAAASVNIAIKSQSSEDYNTAQKWIQKLKSSTVKQKLKAKLKQNSLEINDFFSL